MGITIFPGIVVKGAFGVELYIKGSTDYYRILCTYNEKPQDTRPDRYYTSTDDIQQQNLLEFTMCPSAHVTSQLTYNQLFPVGSDIDFSGSEVYVKKDSNLYGYINREGYDSYINTYKPYIYLGRLYPSGIENIIYIDTFGLKDYALEALPPHQRTENMREFFGVAFDKFYSQIYLKMKDSLSLSDPNETRDEYLRYLLETYGMTSIGSYNADRFYINNLPALLKRKGTYGSIYAVWKILTQTVDMIHIYDFWHQAIADTSITNVEEYCISASIPYAEKRFNSVSDPIPTTGAGSRYYDVTPNVTDMIPSPHYRVEMDLSDVPLDGSEIISSDTATLLHDKFDEMKPVARFANYDYLLRLDSDFTYNSYNTYVRQKSFAITTCYDQVWSFLPGTYVFSNKTLSTEWVITHNFGDDGTNNVPLVQCYKKIGSNYVYILKRVIPKTIKRVDANKLTVIFDEPVSGYAFLSSNSTVWESLDITSASDLGRSLDTISVIYNTTNTYEYQIEPKDFYYNSGLYQILSASASTLEVSVLCTDPTDSIVVSAASADPITISHPLNSRALLIDVYRKIDGAEEYHKIFPEDIEITDEHNLTISVSRRSGYTDDSYVVLIKKIMNTDNLNTMGDVIGSFVDNVQYGHGESIESYSPITLEAQTGVMKDRWIHDEDYHVEKITVENPAVLYDFYTIKIVMRALKDINITEVGLFSGDEGQIYTEGAHLLYYTKCSNLYLKKDTRLILYYNIGIGTL